MDTMYICGCGEEFHNQDFLDQHKVSQYELSAVTKKTILFQRKIVKIVSILVYSVMKK